MEENNSTKNISDEAILERSFSYCNEAIKTILLQCRRLQTTEPEDSEFVFRKWTDLRFLILSFDRLEKSLKIARNISSIAAEIDDALERFHHSIPFLKKFRNVGEHIDYYSLDKGWIKSIDRKQLQVGTWDGVVFSWLDEQLDVVDAKNASIELFKTFQAIKNNFFHFLCYYKL